MHIRLKCKTCGKDFLVKAYRKKTAKYCSVKCSQTVFQKGQKATGIPYKKGSIPWTKGKKHTAESKNKMSQALKGRKPPKTAFTSERTKGQKNVNWKGGITLENEKIRKSTEYQEWRKLVFKRDDYKCMACLARGYINAHHIKPFRQYPELRFDINNGITLCLTCHRFTINREHLFIDYFQGIIDNGVNSAKVSEEITPSQQERLRKALWACVTVSGE